MRYEIFVINIIIEPKKYWENLITYSDINRWYSNKVRCKKSALTSLSIELPRMSPWMIGHTL